MELLSYSVVALAALAIGLGAGLAFRASEKAQHVIPDQPEPPVDPDVVRLLEVLRSAVAVIDDDGAVVRATAPAYALGVLRDGRVAPPAIDDMVAEVWRTGEIQDAEIEIPRGPLSDSVILLQVRVAQLRGDQVVVLAEDRTQARRLEAIRRDFVVNVSHELKTPVGALSLLAETMEDAADDPDAVRRFSTKMQTESQRLSALVQEIIELSRLQVAGALQQIAVVSVDGVLSEAVDRARVKASAKEIRIAVGGDQDLTVAGDHALLVQAVRNLIDNAVSYSAEGTSVSVGARQIGDVVEITVVDQGIGITEEAQNRIFERFYRVDEARSRQTGGTGLGLSIVKHVAADHGGDVSVWSRVGQGSTFKLRIPVADRGPR